VTTVLPFYPKYVIKKCVKRIVFPTFEVLREFILYYIILYYIILYIYIYILLAEMPGVARDFIRNEGIREINYDII
jgi:hypothetical protein